ncbi:MAG: hypothetical protein LUH42_04210 [Oscillospiraceae bacterium]|nr:hypothetical protein [Oscillospiraceae bacterium]
MSQEILQALSPWSEVDTSALKGLNERLDTLEGKTVGMFGDFMILATYMLKSVEKELAARYKNVRFSYIQYNTETTMIEKDTAFYETYKQWLEGVDCVLCFYGSVPSSSLYLGYNAALTEKLGKPTVMLVVPRTYPAGIRGVKAMGVPGLRTIQYDITVDKVNAHVDQDIVDAAMAPDIKRLTDELVDGLCRPLTAEERTPSMPDQHYAQDTYTGTAREISRRFYKLGFTNGAPIEIPTPEAVEEMLRGTDLPRDYVVGRIPPKMGLATVERIAINAAMAGCLPTYMPVLIAAVQGALDERIILEGWTCSQSTWGPVLTLSGPVVKDIGLNVGDNFLSPYYKPNAAIARAFGYIMINIGGLRPGIEDLSEMGHENRLGFCIGDNTEKNPWSPLHVDFGFAEEDSAVTMFWPQEHRALSGHSVADFLSGLCKINVVGWEPGMEIIMTPICAKMFADEGWDKKRILEYVVEYARRPGSEVDIRWLIGNNHIPANVSLPVDMTHSTRTFWDTKHMFALVGGGSAGPMMTVLAGGGDHGGPSCTRIELPARWKDLVAEYADIRPEYIAY